jgi:ABC-2 type transport system ATP-binding protein
MENSGVPSATTAVHVAELRMSYGAAEALRGIDLEVGRGEILACVGPNGAGKTTMLEILEGFRRRTAGDVEVLGVDPEGAGATWRDRIGVVLQESAPEPELTAAECMVLYAGYYARPRPVPETLALVGLERRADVRCARLSGGERRRLDVGLALIGDPELVFLDEPTTGFDPVARRAAWDMIDGLRGLGKTVLLTTHYMEEAERLADRVAVISSGRIVATGTPESLGGRDQEAATIRFVLPRGAAAADLPGEVAAVVRVALGPRVEAQSSDPLTVLGALARWAAARGVEVRDLAVSRPTLEDTYLRLTEQPEKVA